MCCDSKCVSEKIYVLFAHIPKGVVVKGFDAVVLIMVVVETGVPAYKLMTHHS